MIDSILDLLIAEGVITHEGYLNVRSKPTPMEKTRELYDLLYSSGPKAKDVFYKGKLDKAHQAETCGVEPL